MGFNQCESPPAFIDTFFLLQSITNLEMLQMTLRGDGHLLRDLSPTFSIYNEEIH